jgi:hypothetical protein
VVMLYAPHPLVKAADTKPTFTPLINILARGDHVLYDASRKVRRLHSTTV